MNKIKKFLSNIVNVSDVGKIYEALISVLDYKNSVNFSDGLGDQSLFDAEYRIIIDGIPCPIIGIKLIKCNDEREVAKIHLKFWNKNDIPFSIIILPGEIRVYNNFTVRDRKLLFSSLNLKNALDFNDLCNSRIISNLVNKKLEKYIKKSERVDQRLLDNLRTTIQLLYNKHSMDLEAAYSFLAQCIFVKYLEDRGIINLASDAFQNVKVDNFTELLDTKNSTLIATLFKRLKYKFNGDLFDVGDNCKELSGNQLGVIAQFFKGEDLGVDGSSQLFFFKYDFSIIPIELISNIYETFFSLGDRILDTKIAKQDGAYYTPYYLADFMVSTCFDRINSDRFIMLDPACGSGVFLVSCYKKMVDAYIKEHNKITSKELKAILKEYIHGIDINDKALKIACFSLYVAMLDYLEPKDIYENRVQLPRLIEENLICEDFFNPVLNLWYLKADLIIGNPPWISSKDRSIKKYARKQGVSDQQTGQLFTLRALAFAHENTLISLIVPNSIFINKNAGEFRKRLFTQCIIKDVLNMHWMKNSLFANAKAPCSILTYQPSSNDIDYTFNYYSFRLNLITNVLNKIVYDKDEIIYLKKSVVIKNEDIWYILTSGDNFDVQAISYLKEHPSLNEQMQSLKVEYGRGYAVGNGKDYCPDFLEYKGGNLHDCFKSYCIDYQNLPQITEDCYERPRKLSFYQHTNKLLVKRTYNTHTGRAASTDKIFIFSDDFHQLADITGKNKNLIYYLEALYNSDLFEYYCFHCTKNAVSIKPEISKGNLLDFPVPEFSFNNEIITKICDLVKSIKQLKDCTSNLPILSGKILQNDTEIEETQLQLNEKIYDLYDLSKVERETISFTLHHIIPEYRSKTIAYATDADYHNYSQEICDLLNKLLSDSGYFVSLNVLKPQSLFSIAIFNVSKKDSKKLNTSSNQILTRLPDLLGVSSLEMLDGEMIIKNRIVGFMPNGFYFIKTKERKNWTIMSAIKDANYIMKHSLSQGAEK